MRIQVPKLLRLLLAVALALASGMPQALAQGVYPTRPVRIIVPTSPPGGADVVARLHKEAVAILRTPEISERLARDGGEVVGSTPEEFGAYIRAETTKWAKVAKAAGMRPE